MANQYQNRQSFSQVSNELLARYFEARDVDLDVGFGELTETIFETFIALPEEQHAQIGNASIIDDSLVVFNIAGNKYKRVFGLVIDFGTSQSPKSTRPLTTYLCPSRPGHPALRNNFASSLLLRTWLPMTGRRVRRPTLFSLWRKARRENSAASRLLGSTSLRFALHGWQRRLVVDVDYVRQAMFVKFVGTHAKYDKLDLKGK